MAFLRMTMIDVGWGDSIFLEADDAAGNIHYALIDSNDTTYYTSSRIFLKRYFEKQGIDIASSKPLFKFTMLTHNHSDHGQGLKTLMKDFGTKDFWYSKSRESKVLGTLIQYANHSGNVKHHEAVDTTKPIPDFGQAKVKVLWPKKNEISADENNNSVVLLITLSEVSFLLTGDAEEAVWSEIADEIPDDTRVFKVPHHGSKNGFFDGNGDPNWLEQLPDDTRLAISSHIKPFDHPDQEVIDELDHAGYTEAVDYYRTDKHFHVSFETDGIETHDIQVKYWH